MLMTYANDLSLWSLTQKNDTAVTVDGFLKRRKSGSNVESRSHGIIISRDLLFDYTREVFMIL